MTLRYLFLDIDGVCNHRFVRAPAAVPRSDADELDPWAIVQLNRIVQEVPDLRVVLSSTWRYDPGRQRTLEALRSRGYQGTLDDETPIRREGDGLLWPETIDRGVEVQMFLWMHKIDPAFICVLDDEDVWTVRHRQIRCDPIEGLTAVKASLAIDLLLACPT